jgi:FtsP/CotA-like multicopper oxidase with cupredoxin domain
MQKLRAVRRSRSARLLGGLVMICAVAVWVAAPGTSVARTASSATTTVPNQLRTYYIAADKVVWDYAPAGSNLITGQPFGDTENTYVASGVGRIGSKYVKCLYRGYTDSGFGTLIQRPASDAYLGFLGPVIRAQVGDAIRVVFRNRCPFPASIHPHGVFYKKNAEGAPYNDGTSGSDKADDAVQPGSTFTYNWQVPDRAGPGPMEGSSVMWMYHSHTDEVSDVYAGLTGVMEITRRGQARADGSPVDVDRELFNMFLVANENSSPLLQESLDRFATPPFPPLDDEDFVESNLMHSINGYVYGNQPLPVIRVGQRVRWYTMAMGTEVDLHTPHWHGNTVTVGGMRTDVIQLLPAAMVTADMVPDDPGIWLFHCHVGDHITAGMLTRYRVVT